MIDTIIFDVGMVLVDFCWKEHIAGFGFPEETAKIVGEAVFQSAAWAETDKGILSEAELTALFIQNAPEYEKEIRQVCADFGGAIRQYEYAVPWIKELKEKGYKVYILSNYGEKTYFDSIKELNFMEEADGGIFSYTVKKVKPEPEIYLLLAEKYNLQPENCVFLDDSRNNVEAARKLGFHAIQFTERKQAVLELQKLGVN